MNTDSNELKVTINSDELKKVRKKYKKLKKYMKSSLFEIKKLDDNEKVINRLLKDVNGLMENQN